jgi:hypothetical protein
MIFHQKLPKILGISNDNTTVAFRRVLLFLKQSNVLWRRLYANHADPTKINNKLNK